MGRILRKLKSLYRGDNAEEGAQRQVENTDALSAAAGGPGMIQPQSGSAHAGAPPNYVPPADEGRPRH